MVREDFAYYTMRAAEEAAAADRSDCPKAAEAHRQMARFYCDKIERAVPTAGQPQPTGQLA